WSPVTKVPTILPSAGQRQAISPGAVADGAGSAGRGGVAAGVDVAGGAAVAGAGGADAAGAVAVVVAGGGAGVPAAGGGTSSNIADTAAVGRLGAGVAVAITGVDGERAGEAGLPAAFGPRRSSCPT